MKLVRWNSHTDPHDVRMEIRKTILPFMLLKTTLWDLTILNIDSKVKNILICVCIEMLLMINFPSRVQILKLVISPSSKVFFFPHGNFYLNKIVLNQVTKLVFNFIISTAVFRCGFFFFWKKITRDLFIEN